MRAFLIAVGILAVAIVFGRFEPASASEQPITSEDVNLISEQSSNLEGSQSAYRSGFKNGQVTRRSAGRG